MHAELGETLGPETYLFRFPTVQLPTQRDGDFDMISEFSLLLFTLEFHNG